MDVFLILKIAGIGFLIAIADKVVSGAGKANWAPVIDLAAILLVLLMLLDLVNKLFASVRTIFQL